MQNNTKQARISASLLSADFSCLKATIEELVLAGIDAIHLDVMDHHYVPNLSFGALVPRALRAAGVDVWMDAHLMVEQPEKYVMAFSVAGVNLLTFHPETTQNPEGLIDAIHSAGMQAGVAFNPDQSVDLTPAMLNKVDMILLMSVFPGFGGQTFIPSIYEKIRDTRVLIDQVKRPIYLGVDGGVKLENIADVVGAGADFIVMGSGLLGFSPYKTQVKRLQDAVSGKLAGQ